MALADDFRRCLEELDVVGIRRLWRYAEPNLPQLETAEEVLIALHHARTVAASVTFSKRAYSHRWLIDNGYPSGLPDELKPRAERIYPRIVSAVGICVRAGSPDTEPLAKELEHAMSNAVLDVYADCANPDPDFVKVRMAAARAETMRRLMGV